MVPARRVGDRLAPSQFGTRWNAQLEPLVDDPTSIFSLSTPARSTQHKVAARGLCRADVRRPRVAGEMQVPLHLVHQLVRLTGDVVERGPAVVIDITPGNDARAPRALRIIIVARPVQPSANLPTPADVVPLRPISTFARPVASRRPGCCGGRERAWASARCRVDRGVVNLVTRCSVPAGGRAG